MMISLLLSRVLGIIRDMVIAWRFGQNYQTDAYRLSFQIPDLLFYMIAGGALSSAFIPVFSEYLHTDREDDAWHVFSAVTTIMSLLVIGLIAVAWVYALPLAGMVAPGKPVDQLPLIATMSRILLPAQFAFFIGGLLFGTFYARQVFGIPALSPNIYNLGIIFGALVIANFVTPGVIGMSWGALIGAYVANLVVPAWALRKAGVRFKPSLDWRHPGVKKVFVLMLPVVLGLSLPQVYALILQWFGSFYAAGVNSALDMANKLMQAPIGVFGQSMALAVFPALAQFYAQKRMDAYRDQLARTLRTVLYLSLPVTAILIAIPGPLVKIAFEHGNFTPADTERTAACLRMFAFGVAPWCVQPVLMRAYYALQRTVPPIVMGTLTTLLFIGMSAAFYYGHVGFASLPLAGSLSAVFLVAVMMVGMRKTACGLDVPGIMKTLGKALGASAVAGAPLYVALNYGLLAAPHVSKLELAVAVLVLCLVFAWLYYFITRALKMPETAYVKNAMARLDRGKSGPEQPS